jgi:hypothetical protein
MDPSWATCCTRAALEKPGIDGVVGAGAMFPEPPPSPFHNLSLCVLRLWPKPLDLRVCTENLIRVDCVTESPKRQRR